NRGSHFYLSLYWAQELAAQTDDADLAKAFAPVAETLAANEQKIVDELIAVQGKPADIGGYYQPDPVKAAAVMRPSATWNEVLASLSSCRGRLPASPAHSAPAGLPAGAEPCPGRGPGPPRRPGAPGP